MKKIILSVLFISMFFISCASTSSTPQVNPESTLKYNLPKNIDFEVMNGMTAKVTKVVPVNNAILYKGQTFTPSGTGNVAFKAVISFTNNTEKDYSSFPIGSMELVTINESGDISFHHSESLSGRANWNPASIPGVFASNNKDAALPAGATKSEDVFFVYPKVNTPIAITLSRKPVFTLYTDKTSNAELYDNCLYKIKKIDECMEMVKSSTAEQIKAFMDEWGITFKDKNTNGLSLLVSAIIFNKKDIFDMALDQSDLTVTVSQSRSFERMDLLSLAIIEKNKYAVDKLLTKGFSLDPAYYTEKKLTHPIEIAIKSNNLDAVRFLVDQYKFDVSNIVINMAWGNKVDAEKYCRDRKYVELADYLASKKKR